MNDIEFLGWMLLCVIPPEGDRYAVHLRTMIRRDRLAPVLPVALRRSKPMEIEIAWDDAPEVRALDVEEPELEPFEIESAEEAPEDEAREVSASTAEAAEDGVPPAAEAQLVLAATEAVEKPKPRRATRKPASENGEPARPRPKKKPPESSNGQPARGQAKPRTRARAARKDSSGESN
jgi:hypothetical protein